MFCCLVFAVFLGGMAFLTGYGYQYGHPDKLLSPIGGDGNICGVSPGFEEYPYLFIADINMALTGNIFKYGVCVKSCPKTSQEAIQCKPTADVRSCNLSKEDKYGTTYFFEYCMPVYETLDPSVQRQWTTLNNELTQSKSGSVIMDIYDARYVIAGGILLAILFTFAYIKFMDKAAYQLAWFSVILLEVIFVGIGTAAWYSRAKVLADSNPDNDYDQTLWWTAVIFWAVAAAYALFVFCFWNALKVSIAIIETAADYFADTKRIVLVPVTFFITAIVVFVIWLCGIVCVHSIGDISVVSVASQDKEVVHSDETWYMLCYMWFGIFWLLAFVVSCNEFVIIVSTCTWYFSRKDIPDDDGIPGDSEVMKGFSWAFKYHTGSIALGSLILAVVWVIRALFEYVGNLVEKASGENVATRLLIGCIRCCLDCFDRFVRFVNMNAFIYLAISNENFCSSALNAFILVLKNAAKFSFVNTIGGMFMLIARLVIALSSTILCWFWIKEVDEVDSRSLPMLIIFACSYFIAAIFVSIFDASANTILQCYLIDLDIARQSNLEPTHVPPTLQAHLGLMANEDEDDRKANELKEGGEIEMKPVV